VGCRHQHQPAPTANIRSTDTHLQPPPAPGTKFCTSIILSQSLPFWLTLPSRRVSVRQEPGRGAARWGDRDVPTHPPPRAQLLLCGRGPDTIPGYDPDDDDDLVSSRSKLGLTAPATDRASAAHQPHQPHGARPACPRVHIRAVGGSRSLAGPVPRGVWWRHGAGAASAATAWRANLNSCCPCALGGHAGSGNRAAAQCPASKKRRNSVIQLWARPERVCKPPRCRRSAGKTRGGSCLVWGFRARSRRPTCACSPAAAAFAVLIDLMLLLFFVFCVWIELRALHLAAPGTRVCGCRRHGAAIPAFNARCVCFHVGVCTWALSARVRVYKRSIGTEQGGGWLKAYGRVCLRSARARERARCSCEVVKALSNYPLLMFYTVTRPALFHTRLRQCHQILNIRHDTCPHLTSRD